MTEPSFNWHFATLNRTTSKFAVYKADDYPSQAPQSCDKTGALQRLKCVFVSEDAVYTKIASN